MSASEHDPLDGRDSITPPEHQRLHKWLLGWAIFLFLYLVVEAAFLMPYILIKWGWQ
ncbi:MAG: hypothetical protein AB7G37_13310 [Solirubrobacteraceae bacterium]